MSQRIKVKNILSIFIYSYYIILTADHKKYNTDEIPEYVDMNRTAVRQRTESQHYTHMSSLDKKQLPPTYENMHTY